MDNKNEKTEEVIEIKEASVNEEANADNKPAAAPMPATQPVTSGKAACWGDKNVTRKFLIIALAVALALNVALSAGVMKLLGPGRGFDKGGSGRPGFGQQFDNGRGGGNNMMPPSGNQQPGSQQNQQSENQQSDSQQNGSQQSEKQDSSQEKA